MRFFSLDEFRYKFHLLKPNVNISNPTFKWAYKQISTKEGSQRNSKQIQRARHKSELRAQARLSPAVTEQTARQEAKSKHKHIAN